MCYVLLCIFVCSLSELSRSAYNPYLRVRYFNPYSYYLNYSRGNLLNHYKDPTSKYNKIYKNENYINRYSLPFEETQYNPYYLPNRRVNIFNTPHRNENVNIYRKYVSSYNHRNIRTSDPYSSFYYSSKNDLLRSPFSYLSNLFKYNKNNDIIELPDKEDMKPDTEKGTSTVYLKRPLKDFEETSKISDVGEFKSCECDCRGPDRKIVGKEQLFPSEIIIKNIGPWSQEGPNRIKSNVGCISLLYTAADSSELVAADKSDQGHSRGHLLSDLDTFCSTELALFVTPSELEECDEEEISTTETVQRDMPVTWETTATDPLDVEPSVVSGKTKTKTLKGKKRKTQPKTSSVYTETTADSLDNDKDSSSTEGEEDTAEEKKVELNDDSDSDPTDDSEEPETTEEFLFDTAEEPEEEYTSVSTDFLKQTTTIKSNQKIRKKNDKPKKKGNILENTLRKNSGTVNITNKNENINRMYRRKKTKSTSVLEPVVKRNRITFKYDDFFCECHQNLTISKKPKIKSAAVRKHINKHHKLKTIQNPKRSIAYINYLKSQDFRKNTNSTSDVDVEPYSFLENKEKFKIKRKPSVMDTLERNNSINSGGETKPLKQTKRCKRKIIKRKLNKIQGKRNRNGNWLSFNLGRNRKRKREFVSLLGYNEKKKWKQISTVKRTMTAPATEKEEDEDEESEETTFEMTERYFVDPETEEVQFVSYVQRTTKAKEHFRKKNEKYKRKGKKYKELSAKREYVSRDGYTHLQTEEEEEEKTENTEEYDEETTHVTTVHLTTITLATTTTTTEEEPTTRAATLHPFPTAESSTAKETVEPTLRPYSEKDPPGKVACEREHRVECVCSLDVVIADLGQLLQAHDTNEDHLLTAVTQYNCSEYRPINASFTLSSDLKPRLITNKHKELTVDEKSGPKEVLDETLNQLLARSSPHKGVDFYVFPSTNIEIPCFSSTEIQLSPNTADSTKYKWTHSNKKAITEGRIVEDDHHRGSLQINGITIADTDNYTCTVNFTNPDTGKPESNTFIHTIMVVSTPKLALHASLHYTAKAKCDQEILEMFELYLPQQVEELICARGEDKPVCSIEIHNPMCHTGNVQVLEEITKKYVERISREVKKEPEIGSEDMEMSLNFEADLPEVSALVPGATNRTQCNPFCQQKILIKLINILKSSLTDALGHPVNSAVGVTFEPNIKTFKLKVLIGCEGGLKLSQGFCIACPVHTYSEEGNTECTKCPGGQYQINIGSKSCELCPHPFQSGCSALWLSPLVLSATIAISLVALMILVCICHGFSGFIMAFCPCCKRRSTSEKPLRRKGVIKRTMFKKKKQSSHRFNDPTEAPTPPSEDFTTG